MKCLKMFLLMWVVTGILYPAVVTIIAQTTMKHKAEGSLISTTDAKLTNSKLIGSKLIAQKFSSDRYFWPRPSSGDYNPLASGGSNLGPISPALVKAVAERKAKYASSDVPAELLYASGSGLDPHISPNTAFFQIERVAKARNMPQEALKMLVTKHIERQFLGRPCVNVLKLNIALDGIH